MASIGGTPHRFEFAPEGGFKFFRGEALFQAGSYAVKDATIELTDVDDNPSACPPGDEPGVYSYWYDGKSLKLEKTRDTCQKRAGDIPRTWTKQ